MFRKEVVIRCNEQDIVELIQARFDKGFDSIVADQEIGNEDWVTHVEEASDYDLTRIANPETHFMCNPYMNQLCTEGKLEAGEYIIDCTW